jgi:hypothetical protein
MNLVMLSISSLMDAWMKKVSTNQFLGMLKKKGVKRVEINFERVVVWTLVFTNTFFSAYFFAKLFQWV